MNFNHLADHLTMVTGGRKGLTQAQLANLGPVTTLFDQQKAVQQEAANHQQQQQMTDGNQTSAEQDRQDEGLPPGTALLTDAAAFATLGAGSRRYSGMDVGVMHRTAGIGVPRLSTKDEVMLHCDDTMGRRVLVNVFAPPVNSTASLWKPMEEGAVDPLLAAIDAGSGLLLALGGHSMSASGMYGNALGLGLSQSAEFRESGAHFAGSLSTSLAGSLRPSAMSTIPHAYGGAKQPPVDTNAANTATLSCYLPSNCSASTFSAVVASKLLHARHGAGLTVFPDEMSVYWYVARTFAAGDDEEDFDNLDDSSAHLRPTSGNSRRTGDGRPGSDDSELGSFVGEEVGTARPPEVAFRAPSEAGSQFSQLTGRNEQNRQALKEQRRVVALALYLADLAPAISSADGQPVMPIHRLVRNSKRLPVYLPKRFKVPTFLDSESGEPEEDRSSGESPLQHRLSDASTEGGGYTSARDSVVSPTTGGPASTASARRSPLGVPGTLTQCVQDAHDLSREILRSRAVKADLTFGSKGLLHILTNLRKPTNPITRVPEATMAEILSGTPPYHVALHVPDDLLRVRLLQGEEGRIREQIEHESNALPELFASPYLKLLNEDTHARITWIAHEVMCRHRIATQCFHERKVAEQLSEIHLEENCRAVIEKEELAEVLATVPHVKEQTELAVLSLFVRQTVVSAEGGEFITLSRAEHQQRSDIQWHAVLQERLDGMVAEFIPRLEEEGKLAMLQCLHGATKTVVEARMLNR